MYGFITELMGQRLLGHLKGAESVRLVLKIVRNFYDKFSDVFFLSIKFVEESICQMAATLFKKVATLTCTFISVKRPFSVHYIYIKRHILLFSDDYFADSSLLQCLLDHMMTVGENRISILNEKKRKSYSTSDIRIISDNYKQSRTF